MKINSNAVIVKNNETNTSLGFRTDHLKVLAIGKRWVRLLRRSVLEAQGLNDADNRVN